jgi:hypothetical protein
MEVCFEPEEPFKSSQLSYVKMVKERHVFAGIIQLLIFKTGEISHRMQNACQVLIKTIGFLIDNISLE